MLTACLKGEIPWRLTHNDPAGARARALELQKVFGDRLYLEIQENGIPEQTIANQGLMALAKELGIKLVATNDCHYLTQEESYAHEVLLSIQTGKTINDPNRFRFNTDQLYFKSGDEMVSPFPLLPEALSQHPGSGRALQPGTGFQRQSFPDLSGQRKAKPWTPSLPRPAGTASRYGLIRCANWRQSPQRPRTPTGNG